MTFQELKIELDNCKGLNFISATQKLKSVLFAISKEDLLGLIVEIGTIPEDIIHDSTEEKLYTKTSDILLAKSLMELNLDATVLTQRADCADVIAQSHYHKYSLVGDAKAFRLSRTAKNAKDYKVASMVGWKEDRDYAVLVCPYFQYPKTRSQIFKEALNGNVSLFSWEYLYILLSRNVKESETMNISQLWNQSAVIADKTTIANSKENFLGVQNRNISDFIGISIDSLYGYFNDIKGFLIKRGHEEIQYYEHEIDRIKSLERDEAIKELLKSMKIDGKITTIRNFIDQLNVNND